MPDHKDLSGALQGSFRGPPFPHPHRGTVRRQQRAQGDLNLAPSESFKLCTKPFELKAWSPRYPPLSKTPPTVHRPPGALSCAPPSPDKTTQNFRHSLASSTTCPPPSPLGQLQSFLGPKSLGLCPHEAFLRTHRGSGEQIGSWEASGNPGTPQTSPQNLPQKIPKTSLGPHRSQGPPNLPREPSEHRGAPEGGFGYLMEVLGT